MESKPTILVQQYRDAAQRAATSNTYGGLRVHALPGLHDVIGKLCGEHLRPGGRLLDLAAGSGAMSARLRDQGFSMVATDYVTENFQATGIPFSQADLNEPFSRSFDRESFDGIIASEIIEHLENPFHFFRQCATLLATGGKLVLTTPNTQSPASIASLIRSGEFLWFSEIDRNVQGHISPLTQWQLRYAAKAAGLTVEWEGSFGSVHSKLAGSPRMKILEKLLGVLSGTPADLQGEIYLCVARKIA